MTNTKPDWTPFCFKNPKRSASVFLLLFLVAGCNRSPDPASPQDVAAVTSTDDETQTVTDTKNSDQRATSFAKKLREAIVSGNSRAVAQLIAWPEIISRAAEPFQIAQQDKSDLIRDAVNSASQITEQITNAVRNGSDYQLVHVKQRDGEPFALFRLLSVDGTLNYHLFRIRNIRERLRADQFFSAVQGGEMADAFTYLIVDGAKNFMVSGQVAEDQKRFIEDLEIVQRLADAVSFGFNERGLQIYNRLPDRLKRSRLPMLNRIKATPMKDAAAYVNAIKEYLAKFPDDTAGAMTALDAGVSTENIDLLQQGHRMLAEWSGGDPYLDLLVGAEFAKFGQHDLALQTTQAIDPSTAGTPMAHSLKLNISLAVDDHAEVLNQLRILRDKYRITPNQMEQIEEFNSFVESPEFQQWKNE